MSLFRGALRTVIVVPSSILLAKASMALFAGFWTRGYPNFKEGVEDAWRSLFSIIVELLPPQDQMTGWFLWGVDFFIAFLRTEVEGSDIIGAFLAGLIAIKLIVLIRIVRGFFRLLFFRKHREEATT